MLMTNIQVYEETLAFASTFWHSHTHHILAGWDFEFSLPDAPPHLLFKSLVVTTHVNPFNFLVTAISAGAYLLASKTKQKISG